MRTSEDVMGMRRKRDRPDADIGLLLLWLGPVVVFVVALLMQW